MKTEAVGFSADEIIAKSRGARFPRMLSVPVTPDLAERLSMLGHAGMNVGDVLNDAAREGVHRAFESWVATLPAERQAAARAQARQGDDDLAESIAYRLRMLESDRRGEEHERRMRERRAIENAPKPKTEAELLADAVAPWLLATASRGWAEEYVSAHRGAVLAALGGTPLRWPYQPLPECRAFESEVRRILGVDPDADLSPEQVAIVRGVARQASMSLADARAIGAAAVAVGGR